MKSHQHNHPLTKNTIFSLVLFITFVHNVFAQENDDCANAIALSVGTTCTPSVYTNSGADSESETVAKDPTCGLYQGGDVWFTAEMPASGALRIETDNLGGATPHSITVYSGTCGTFNEVICIRQDKDRTFFDPSLAGETLYIRMFSLNGIPGSSFELCAWEPPIPANDNCESAIELPASENCTVDIYTNAYTTSESFDMAPKPSCGAYEGGDVWFKTVIPASGNLRIETNNISGATSKSVSVSTGSCGDLTEVFCSELDDKGSFFDPDWAGEAVYIRIFSFGSEEGGDFELCVSNPTQPLNDDCSQAIDLTAGDNCNPQIFTNALAISEPVTVAPDPSCGEYRGGDVWFKTVMPDSGNLSLETNNLAGVNAHSITIYRGECNTMKEVFCSELDEEVLFHDPALAGQVLYIRMYTYANEEGGPFNICAYNHPCLNVDTSVTQDGLTMTATNGNATYQWVDCNLGNAPIAGETGQSFTASSDGSYAVIITENSCTEASECYNINIVGLLEDKYPEMKIFPNPVNGLLHVELGGYYKRISMELINMDGQKMIKKQYYDKSMVQLDMNQTIRGMYILKINTEQGVAIAKLIKE